jgi:pyruvate dehydrogenase E1 component beta subunit
MMKKITYASAILEGFEYLLENYPKVFVLGQGVWSPWYVGSSMKDLEKKFGKHRVIDTPVSESACNGIGVGASLYGYRPIVIHPRMDFMLYGMDAMVNQAAKWSAMLGGEGHPCVTFRAIINRGGEQGAQHSQALHSWFAHVPGLRVVMPSSPLDARDLLISSVLSDDPVLYIDDRWLYEQEETYQPAQEKPLAAIAPKILLEGNDLTLVGTGYTTFLCKEVAHALKQKGVSAEIIDVSVLNPLNSTPIIHSVKKTGSLYVLDGGWKNCGFAGEIIASVMEKVEISSLKNSPKRFTLPDAPAPSSAPLERAYYLNADKITNEILGCFKNERVFI